MFTFREKSYKIWLWYLFGNIYLDKCIYRKILQIKNLKVYTNKEKCAIM